MHRSFALALFSVGLMPIERGQRPTWAPQHPIGLAVPRPPGAFSARHRPPPVAVPGRLESLVGWAKARSAAPTGARPFEGGWACGACRRHGGACANSRSLRHRRLRGTLAVLMFGIGLLAAIGVAVAHHSLAMFDREHPIQLIGTVREFKFVSPHAFIALEVGGKEARTVIWNLEGDSPNSLKWDGWSSQSLKPGDELRVTVEPLRSGAPGGAWHARNTTYKDGTPIVGRP